MKKPTKTERYDKSSLIKLKPHDGAQSIYRTIAILREVSNFGEEGGRLTQIAENVNLHVSTARRILLVLSSEGFINFDPVSKLYNIGPEIYSLQTVPNYSSIRESYRLALEQIAAETGDTAYLVIRSGFDTVCIDRVEGHHFIRILYDIGQRIPVGIAASGIAILASLPVDEMKRILTANGRRYKHYGNMDAIRIDNLVKQSLRLGYSLSESTYQQNVNGVALPIYNNKKYVIGAISVAAISDRLNRKRSAEVAKLIKSNIRIVQT